MATSARPVALITGASAGIGVALAREAANDGHDLVLVARRREPMEALAAELKSMGAEITVIPADLSRPGAAAALMETVGQRGLPIDILQCRRRARSAKIGRDDGDFRTCRLEFCSEYFHRFTATRDEYEIVSVACSFTREGGADASRRAGYERNRAS